jgi:hypothetical protein
MRDKRKTHAYLEVNKMKKETFEELTYERSKLVWELCGLVLDIPEYIGSTDDWCMGMFGKTVSELTDSEMEIAIVLARNRRRDAVKC